MHLTEDLYTKIPFLRIKRGIMKAKYLMIILMFCLIMIFFGCVDKGTKDTAQIANPASVYCEEQGYRLEIRTDPDGGQYGVCVFSDGSECGEWKYYRGECGPD